jgi:hypothetical protein
MSIRAIVTLAALWVLSLFIVSSVGAQQAFAVDPLPEPRIISGADVGFRIEGMQKGAPVGRLVIRVDGKWIEARLGTVTNDPRISLR